MGTVAEAIDTHNKGNGAGQRRAQPSQVLVAVGRKKSEELVNAYANEGGQEVASEQGTRLTEWRFYSTVAEDRRRRLEARRVSRAVKV